MSFSITPTKHLVRVYELLLRTYGEPKNEPDYDPLGGLVGTILSQHTSDINSDRAYKNLIVTFRSWEDVRDAPAHLVAEAICSGGLANVKARRIQDVLLMLTELKQEQGVTKSLSEYFYDELTRRTSEDAWFYLRSMPGVGPKTAACVLMFNLNRPVMPVDMQVYRTNNWLGFRVVNILAVCSAERSTRMAMRLSSSACISKKPDGVTVLRSTKLTETIGVLLGLPEGGVDMSDAALIGTSAGSIVGAQTDVQEVSPSRPGGLSKNLSAESCVCMYSSHASSG